MEQLRKWRESRPDIQTLEQAGRALGVSAVQVHRYETGQRNIPATRVCEVSRITGISPHILRPDIFPAPENKASA